MTLIMDGLLLAAACFAGTYCFVLSRRVAALRDLDSGLGAAIVRMTRSLEEARSALEAAKAGDREGQKDLRELLQRAEAATSQLRLLLAATREAPAQAQSRESRGVRVADRWDALTADHEAETPPLRARPALAPARVPAAALLDRERDARVPLQRRGRSSARGPAREADLIAALSDFAASGRF